MLTFDFDEFTISIIPFREKKYDWLLFSLLKDDELLIGLCEVVLGERAYDKWWEQ